MLARFDKIYYLVHMIYNADCLVPWTWNETNFVVRITMEQHFGKERPRTDVETQRPRSRAHGRSTQALGPSATSSGGGTSEGRGHVRVSPDLGRHLTWDITWHGILCVWAGHGVSLPLTPLSHTPSIPHPYPLHLPSFSRPQQLADPRQYSHELRF